MFSLHKRWTSNDVVSIIFHPRLSGSIKDLLKKSLSLPVSTWKAIRKAICLEKDKNKSGSCWAVFLCEIKTGEGIHIKSGKKPSGEIKTDKIFTPRQSEPEADKMKGAKVEWTHLSIWIYERFLSDMRWALALAACGTITLNSEDGSRNKKPIEYFIRLLRMFVAKWEEKPSK